MAVVTAIVRTSWSGTSGGPGLTQLAIEGITDPHTWDAAAAQVAVDAVRTFWNAIAGYLPNELILTTSPVVDVYNIMSGKLVGSHQAATAPASVLGTDAGIFSMASGAKINLNTGVIRNGRRVRGAVFLVPAGATTMSTAGLTSSAARTAINSAVNTMRGTLVAANKQLVVWSRNTTGTEPGDGVTSPVVGVETSEKVAVLRGRRD